MLTVNHLKIVLSAAAVAAIAVTVAVTAPRGGSSHSASATRAAASPASPTASGTAPSADLATANWSPTQVQLAGAEHAMMVVATGADPALSDTAAVAAAQTATAWPSNVTKVEVMATDRASAEAAMDTPGAVTGASGQVLLFQLTGQFTARAYPHPKGAPAPTVATYIHYAIDPSTETALDFGMVPYSMLWDPSAVQVAYSR